VWDQFIEFTQTALWEFIVVNIGAVAALTGIVGLALGGNLPGIRLPRPLRGPAKIVWTFSTIIGITLLTAAPPDLLERVIRELSR